MQHLFMMTVRDLDVRSDWRAVHDRLLDDFPGITEVLATTMAGTILIAYQGPAEIDAWLQSTGEALLSRRRRRRSGTQGRVAPGGGSVA